MNVQLIKQKMDEIMQLLDEGQPQKVNEVKELAQRKQQKFASYANSIGTWKADEAAKLKAEETNRTIIAAGWSAQSPSNGWKVYFNAEKKYHLFTKDDTFWIKKGTQDKVANKNIKDLPQALQSVKSGLI